MRPVYFCFGLFDGRDPLFSLSKFFGLYLCLITFFLFELPTLIIVKYSRAMPHKDPLVRKTKQREYARKHYLANEDLIKARAKIKNREMRLRNRQYVVALKESTPCADCGNTYPSYKMQFDHIYEKGGAIANLVRAGASLERLEREIQNCEIVCANCHAGRTYERLQGDEDLSEWF